jgi:hypothetical protein
MIESNDGQITSAVNYYYKSNNLAAVLKGEATYSNKSLDDFSHFDSTSVSHGATDDGIGSAVMMSCIRNTTC